jgi:hypothetical protein
MRKFSGMPGACHSTEKDACRLSHSGQRGIEVFAKPPCGMRFADEIKVLRFAKLGSQTPLPAARGSGPAL